jgi:hypothetical protein
VWWLKARRATLLKPEEKKPQFGDVALRLFNGKSDWVRKLLFYGV